MKTVTFIAAFFIALSGCKDSDYQPAPLYYPRCQHVCELSVDTMHDNGHEVRIVFSKKANHIECQALMRNEWKWIRLGGSPALGYGVAAYDTPAVPMPDPEIYTFEQWKAWGY